MRHADGIYAIFDTKAQAIIGGLHIHKHEAAAIRFFGDVAAAEQTMINKHPQDYDLIRLGWISEHNVIVAEAEQTTIITGATMKEVQQQTMLTLSPEDK